MVPRYFADETRGFGDIRGSLAVYVTDSRRKAGDPALSVRQRTHNRHTIKSGGCAEIYNHESADLGKSCYSVHQPVSADFFGVFVRFGICTFMLAEATRGLTLKYLADRSSKIEVSGGTTMAMALRWISVRSRAA